MVGLIKRMLLDKKNALFAYSVAIFLFIGLYLALFPAIQDQSEQLSQLLESYPDAFFKAFGLEKADLTFEFVESYLSSEVFSFLWPILVVIFAASLANYSVVTEIAKGTIELTLAQPISRIKIFFARYLAGVISLAIFTAVTIFSIVPLAAIYNIEYRIENFLKMGYVSGLFALAVFSLGMLFSSIFSEKGKASFAVGGTVILMYVLNVVSALKENLESLQYFSFFHYYSPSAVLNRGEIIDYTLWVFVGVTVLAISLGAFIFNRRDVAV
jgi:ABC-2 type transport system permease protein